MSISVLNLALQMFLPWPRKPLFRAANTLEAAQAAASVVFSVVTSAKST